MRIFQVYIVSPGLEKQDTRLPILCEPTSDHASGCPTAWFLINSLSCDPRRGHFVERLPANDEIIDFPLFTRAHIIGVCYVEMTGLCNDERDEFKL